MAVYAAISPKIASPCGRTFECFRLLPTPSPRSGNVLFNFTESKPRYQPLSLFLPVRTILPCIHSIFDDPDDFSLFESTESEHSSAHGESNRNLTDFWTPDYLGDTYEPGSAFKGRSQLCGQASSDETKLRDDVDGKDKVEERDGFIKVGWRWKRKKIDDGLLETVMEVRRVSRMTAGGKRYRYRVIVAVGDRRGKVGAGVGKAVDIMDAIQKAARDARKYIVHIPLTHHLSLTHRTAAKYKAAKIMLMPGFFGTGLRAGGALRQLLDMAGVRNALGKQFGSRSLLNNARAFLLAINKMRYFQEHAIACGMPRYKVFKNMRDFNTLPPLPTHFN